MSRRLPAILLSALTAACAGGVDNGTPDDDPDDDDLTPDAAPSVDGERCEDATSITFPGGVGATTIAATTEAHADDYDLGSQAPDRVYVVTVAAGHRLVTTVTPTSAGFDPALYLVAGAATACAAEPLSWLAAGETVVHVNGGTKPVDLYILVDGASASGGAFELGIDVGPVPPTPVGDTCALAEPVTLVNDFASLWGTVSLLPGYHDDYAPHCDTAAESGNDRVYRVTVPVDRRLMAKLWAPFPAALYVLGGPAETCGDDCLAGDDTTGPTDQAFLTYDNRTAGAQEVFIVVDAYPEPIVQGDYRLAVQLGDTP